MRKVVSFLFMSLDGVVDDPDVWQGEVDLDAMSDLSSLVASQDAALLGREMYQEWSQYWPTATHEPFASFINQSPKYVVSRSLQSVSWGKWDNAILLRGELKEELGKLKQQPGKDIGVHGSIRLVQSLIQQDLLDGLHLWVHPVVAGAGRRLFQEAEAQKRLQLTASKTTRTGTLLLTYQFPRL